MSHKTRQTILDTAKQLFAVRGYNAVSMGDIAQEVGISKGNLTYHFKKKESLIEALIEENSPHYDWVVPITIAELSDYFRHLESVIKDNAFYFWHHAQLAQLSPRIQEKQTEMFAHNRTFLGNALDSLTVHGLMVKMDASTTEALINALLISVTYWLPFQDITNASTITLQQQLWTILHPYLTAKGESEYETLTFD